MNKVKFRVHIVPLGYEIDRILKPIKSMKADRVQLLIHSKDNFAKPYQEIVEEELSNEGVAFQTSKCDITDLYDVLRAMREITDKEKENDIFINVSSGSKIEAIAGMIISMVFYSNVTIKPYYVIPTKYNKPSGEGKPLSEGMENYIILPEYHIEQPEPRYIELLRIIKNSKKNRVSKIDLAKEAQKRDLIFNESSSSKESLIMALNRNYIDPLEHKWKLIKTEKRGRLREITLTEEGENMLIFRGE